MQRWPIAQSFSISFNSLWSTGHCIFDLRVVIYKLFYQLFDGITCACSHETGITKKDTSLLYFVMIWYFLVYFIFHQDTSVRLWLTRYDDLLVSEKNFVILSEPKRVVRICCLSWGLVYIMSSVKFFHSGFMDSIRKTFFSRRHFLICFSRSMADSAFSCTW